MLLKAAIESSCGKKGFQLIKLTNNIGTQWSIGFPTNNIGTQWSIGFPIINL